MVGLKKSHKRALKIFTLILAMSLIAVLYQLGKTEAPNFHSIDIYGNPFSVEEYRGKVILLYFWKVRCIPSMKAVENIRRLSNTYGRMIIVGVCLDQNVTIVKNYVKIRNISWRIIVDNGTISELYGITGTPEFILIDKKGYIACRLKGLRDDFDTIMDEKIRKLKP